MASIKETERIKTNRVPLEEGVEELKAILGDMDDLVFNSNQTVDRIVREDFQSSGFKKSRDAVKPLNHDRSIYTVYLPDQTQVYVIHGAVYNSNLQELIDKESGTSKAKNVTELTAIYRFDGEKSISDLLDEGPGPAVIEGLRTPEDFLNYVRRVSGKPVGRTEFIPPQNIQS